MRKIKGHVALIQFSDFGLGRGLYLAKALSLLGLNVTIFTNKSVYAPTQKFSGDLTLDSSVKVTEFRIPFAKTLYSSILGRLIIYVTFTMLSCLEIFMENPQPKILFSRGPQPFTEISCILYKAFHNSEVKIISDTTDLWPDALEYIQINETLKDLLIGIGHAINNLIYPKVDAIVTFNEELSKVLQERFGRTTHIVYGVIDLDRFKPMGKKEALETLPQNIRKKVSGKFTVLYAGLLGPFQNPLVILEIAKKIAEDNEVLFIIAGTGLLKESMEREVKKYGLGNVLFLETQPFENMPLIYNIADVFLLMYAPIEFLRIGLPKKFIEYAACGKPILCISPPCVASRLCLKWKAGYHVSPPDIETAANVIKILKENKKLKEEMSKNARQLAEDLFSLNDAAETLRKIIHA
jgi:glycosyltransferase involved in cell wall biosynthesis